HTSSLSFHPLLSQHASPSSISSLSLHDALPIYTAVGAITRLQDMGVEPFLLSSSLTGVMAQRLVRTLCPDCRQPAPATDEEKRLDRKSTRLNSSHVSISYAVFCLKKKKEQ